MLEHMFFHKAIIDLKGNRKSSTKTTLDVVHLLTAMTCFFLLKQLIQTIQTIWMI